MILTGAVYAFRHCGLLQICGLSFACMQRCLAELEDRKKRKLGRMSMAGSGYPTSENCFAQPPYRGFFDCDPLVEVVV